MISPGTERAIQQLPALIEQMNRSLKKIEKLLEKLQPREPEKPKEKVDA